MIHRFCFGMLLSFFVSVTSVAVAQTSCIEDSDLPLFADLKTLLSQGDFDDFFEQTKAVHSIDEREVRAAKVGLVQVLGVSAECRTLKREAAEDNLYTDLSAFKSDNGSLVFLLLEAAEFNDGTELLMVQISTDYVVMQKFLR